MGQGHHPYLKMDMDELLSLYIMVPYAHMLLMQDLPFAIRRNLQSNRNMRS